MTARTGPSLSSSIPLGIFNSLTCGHARRIDFTHWVLLFRTAAAARRAADAAVSSEPSRGSAAGQALPAGRTPRRRACLDLQRGWCSRADVHASTWSVRPRQSMVDPRGLPAQSVQVARMALTLERVLLSGVRHGSLGGADLGAQSSSKLVATNRFRMSPGSKHDLAARCSG